MKKELAKINHARSAKSFPDINLEENEYVVLQLHRAHIGIVLIWVCVGVLILLLSFALILIGNNDVLSKIITSLEGSAQGFLSLAIIALYALIIFAGFVAQSIYNQNQMIITNMRAIHKQRITLFSNSTNVIKLSRIEDVSFHQTSVLDHIFNIGTLRMSTVGDETTYTFPFFASSQKEVNEISHLVAKCHPDKN